MELSVTLSQGDLVADVIRDAIEAEAWTVAQRMLLGDAGTEDLHQGAEDEMVAGAVRLHRLASTLNAMDVAWHPETVSWGDSFDPDWCPACHGEDLVRHCPGVEPDPPRITPDHHAWGGEASLQ